MMTAAGKRDVADAAGLNIAEHLAKAFKPTEHTRNGIGAGLIPETFNGNKTPVESGIARQDDTTALTLDHATNQLFASTGLTASESARDAEFDAGNRGSLEAASSIAASASLDISDLNASASAYYPNYSAYDGHGGFIGEYGLYGNSSDYSGLDMSRSYARNNMELSRDYILDYSEYRRVLEECNSTIHNTRYPNDGSVYCNATWDTMECWGQLRAGETAYQLCPAYITHSNPAAYAKKTCMSDGTWYRHEETGLVWTNYTMCYDHSLVENHKQVLYMYYYGFGISIVLLIISLIIFSMFRQLKCVRVTLHKHLFSSYVLTGTMWILYYSLVPMNSTVLLDNPIWCQVLHVLTHYITVCNYTWMFCEGFYLHALIVVAFAKDKKLLFMCYIIGWVFPIIPTIIYTIIRALNEEENKRCWTGDSLLYWIFAGPINVSLIVNFIFSINIMRILLSKLRSVHNNETMQTRRAVRATLILIPLLGLQYIAFPLKPPPGSDGEHVYAMISAFLVSFQGVFVSLVFCFFNGEVLSILGRQITSLTYFRRQGSRRIYGGRRKSSTLTFTLPDVSNGKMYLKRKLPYNQDSPRHPLTPTKEQPESIQMVPLNGKDSAKVEDGYV